MAPRQESVTWKWMAVVLGGIIGSMLVFAVSVLVGVLGDMRRDLNTTMTDVALIKQRMGIHGAATAAGAMHPEG